MSAKVRLASEKTQLPYGTVLDWRYSGNNFDTDQFEAWAKSDKSLILTFDELGIPNGLAPIEYFKKFKSMPVISGSTRFLVRAYRDYDQTINSNDPSQRELEIARRVLNQEDSLWVVASSTSGRTSTKALVPPTSQDSIRKMLIETTELTRAQ